jgi:hypothetical protein
MRLRARELQHHASLQFFSPFNEAHLLSSRSLVFGMKQCAIGEANITTVAVVAFSKGQLTVKSMTTNANSVTPAARLFLHCFTATTHFNTTVK